MEPPQTTTRIVGTKRGFSTDQVGGRFALAKRWFQFEMQSQFKLHIPRGGDVFFFFSFRRCLLGDCRGLRRLTVYISESGGLQAL